MSQINQLISVVQKKLEEDKLILPTLPKIALEVRNACDDPETDVCKMVNILQKDPILGALWKKTQLRLLDSNKKNSELFIEVEAITEELEQCISEQKALSKKSEKLSERISRIKQLLYSSEW